MGIEIERKFLVKANFKSQFETKNDIKQGYISTDPKKTVRVRIKNAKGYLTIKGLSSESGMSRFEWEKEITYKDAMDLLNLCDKPIIEKTRFNIPYNGYVIEVDEFYGENEGLVIAEIELNTENDKINLPEFIGKEVTNNPKYYNSYLSKHPFSKW